MLFEFHTLYGFVGLSFLQENHEAIFITRHKISDYKSSLFTCLYHSFTSREMAQGAMLGMMGRNESSPYRGGR